MTQTTNPQKVRAGLYRVEASDGAMWTIEERREDPAYGRAWMWFATSDDGRALDPMRTLSAAVDALTR